MHRQKKNASVNQPSRRSVLAGVAAGAALATTGWPAAAKEPATLKIGDFRVRSLSDGHLNLPSSMLAANVTDEQRAKALASAGQTGTQYKSPLNVTLIEKAGERILVDVGSGDRFMASAGKLAEALETAGIDAGSITKVVYTHAHPDHLWGTLDEFDEPAFPNATAFVSEAEWNFWMSADVLTKLPKERHGFAVGAQRNLKAIKDTIKTIKPGKEIVSGVSVLDTSGHTPGHISLEVSAGNERVVILGDALTHPVISFQHPDWRPAIDQEPDKAVATRKRLLTQLSSDKSRLIGYHLPAPGTGQVVRKGTGFAFAPLG